MQLKRIRSEVQCEFCGKLFMQSRWWQAYCSKGCLKNSEKTAKATLKKVLPELEYLRKRVKELENNALDHFQGVKKEHSGGNAFSKKLKLSDQVVVQTEWED